MALLHKTLAPLAQLFTPYWKYMEGPTKRSNMKINLMLCLFAGGHKQRAKYEMKCNVYIQFFFYRDLEGEVFVFVFLLKSFLTSAKRNSRLKKRDKHHQSSSCCCFVLFFLPRCHCAAAVAPRHRLFPSLPPAEQSS